MAMVKFVQTTQSKYGTINPKDENTLYFLSDIGVIYKGEVSFNSPAHAVTDYPAAPASGHIYLKESTKEVKLWTGSKWEILITATVQKIEDSVNTTTPVSGDAVKKYVLEKLQNLATQDVAAKVKVSAQAGNKVEQKADGIYVGAGVTLTNGKENALVIGTKDGNIKCADVHIGGATLNVTPTEKTVATEAAVDAVKKELNTTIVNDKKELEGKITSEVTTVRSTASSALNSAKAELEKKLNSEIDTMKNSIKTQATSINTIVKEKVDEAKTEISQSISSMDSKFNNYLALSRFTQTVDANNANVPSSAAVTKYVEKCLSWTQL